MADLNMHGQGHLVVSKRCPLEAPEPGSVSSPREVNGLWVCEVKDGCLKSGSAQFRDVSTLHFQGSRVLGTKKGRILKY